MLEATMLTKVVGIRNSEAVAASRVECAKSGTLLDILVAGHKKRYIFYSFDERGKLHATGGLWEGREVLIVVWFHTLAHDANHMSSVELTYQRDRHLKKKFVVCSKYRAQQKLHFRVPSSSSAGHAVNQIRHLMR